MSKINSLNTELEHDFECYDFSNINLETYLKLLDNFGLEITWDYLIYLISDKTIEKLEQTLFKFDDIGELYEIGLAHTNKITKKQLGKYYTPADVSKIMASLLLENDNIEHIADVGCGTGNLILELINLVIENETFDIIDFIKDGRLWLYDIDPIALKICICKIEVLLQENVKDSINVVTGDFLDRDIVLPKNISVISNPPYSIFKTYKRSWFESEILNQSKDLYAGFFDKILNYARNAVIVSPQSFLVSDKFSMLRHKMGTTFYGEIYAFDNVPGTLFNGRKHGIFNSNNANGVRAAISSIKRNGHHGFKLSHLIRFKTEQRMQVLNLDFLRSKLGTNIQNLRLPLKVFKELEPLVDRVYREPHIFIPELLQQVPESYDDAFKINVSSSARYFTVASQRTLKRKGCYSVYAKDYNSFILLYALLNSSYVYMWWRFFDGGILFSKRYLFKTPINEVLIDLIPLVRETVLEMIEVEAQYLTYKKNAGTNQESIKFPENYRNLLNELLFPDDAQYFKLLHNNFEVNDVE